VARWLKIFICPERESRYDFRRKFSDSEVYFTEEILPSKISGEFVIFGRLVHTSGTVKPCLEGAFQISNAIFIGHRKQNN